jgi:hypothetical protein
MSLMRIEKRQKRKENREGSEVVSIHPTPLSLSLGGTASACVAALPAWIVIARSIYEVDDVAISKFLEKCNKNVTPRIRDWLPSVLASQPHSLAMTIHATMPCVAGRGNLWRLRCTRGVSQQISWDHHAFARDDESGVNSYSEVIAFCLHSAAERSLRHLS